MKKLLPILLLTCFLSYSQDKKISQLTPLPSVNGTELIPVARGGANYYMTNSQLNPYLSGYFWKQGLNAFGTTGTFGTSDNNRIDFYSNNLIRGRLTAGGQWLIGSTFPGFLINSPLISIGTGTTSSTYAFGVYDSGLSNNYFSLRNDSRMIYKDGNQSAGYILQCDANGVATWVANSALSSNWKLLGNSGTTASNFLGTTDNVSLRFRTNNTERLILDSIGGFSWNLGQSGVSENIYTQFNKDWILLERDGKNTSNGSYLFIPDTNQLQLISAKQYSNGITHVSRLMLNGDNAYLQASYTNGQQFGFAVNDSLNVPTSVVGGINVISNDRIAITGGTGKAGVFINSTNDTINAGLTGVVMTGTGLRATISDIVMGNNLDFNTSVKFGIASKGSGKILTSDANGVATWQTNAAQPALSGTGYVYQSGSTTSYTSSIPNASLANSTISGVSLGSNLSNHTAGYGLSGSTYNGSGAISWLVDSTALASKLYVTAKIAAFITNTVTTLSSLSSIGTVTTGVWNGTVLTGQYGGTGVANTGKTITLAGNLTTTGAFNTTFAQQASVTTTLPPVATTLTGKTGTMAANYLGYWNDANQLTGSSLLTFNGTTLGLGAGTNAASFAQAHLNTDGSSGVLEVSSYNNTAATTSSILIARGRGTLASPTAVLVNDVLARFNFGGQYNTTINNITGGAWIQAIAAENWSASALGTDMAFYTCAKLAFANPVERLRITSNGNISLGAVFTPTALLHLAAGTASASTSPLKFTSGTNLTTAEAGAIEYDGTYFYASPSTTRKKIMVGLVGTATLDFASTLAGTATDLTITVTGAADGDLIQLGTPNGSTLADGTFTAWVSAANTVTVRFANNSLTLALDPASGSFNVCVIKP